MGVCAMVSISNYKFDIVAYMFDECLLIHMIHVSFEGWKTFFMCVINNELIWCSNFVCWFRCSWMILFFLLFDICWILFLFMCVLVSTGFTFSDVNLAVMFWRNSWYCFRWFRNDTNDDWGIYVCKSFRNCFSVNTGG